MVSLRLCNNNLWNLFQEQGNEMIITKNGRCMFPILKFFVTFGPEINEYSLVSFSVKIEQCDNYKWKYKNYKWHKTSSSDYEDQKHEAHFYEAPESPNFAQYWAENGVSFAKIKLTNQVGISGVMPPSNYFPLTSFRKYKPVVYCYVWDKTRSQIIKRFIFSVQNTEFFAVTHYQNERITDLKKNHNPHAKGFLTSENTSLDDEYVQVSTEDIEASWALVKLQSKIINI